MAATSVRHGGGSEKPTSRYANPLHCTSPSFLFMWQGVAHKSMGSVIFATNPGAANKHSENQLIRVPVTLLRAAIY